MSLFRRTPSLHRAIALLVTVAVPVSTGGCVPDNGCEATATCRGPATIFSGATPGLTATSPAPTTTVPAMPATAAPAVPTPTSTATPPALPTPSATVVAPSPSAAPTAADLCNGACTAGTFCHVNACVTCVVGTVAQGPSVPDLGCSQVAPLCMNGSQCVECAEDTHCTNPATPVCNADRCVQCTVNTDCSDPAFGVCNPATNRCVQCIAGGDCGQPEASLCSAANQCVQCIADGDCSQPEASSCNAANQCEACGADGDCVGVAAGGLNLNVCKGIADPAMANQCVECTDDQHCASLAVPACDADTNQCVECTDNTDCADPAASVCDVGINRCVPCAVADEGGVNDDCQGVFGVADETAVDGGAPDAGAPGVALNVCQQPADGPTRCVQCTAADERACGDNSCDPVTNTCTQTERGMVGRCESCLADSECALAEDSCVVNPKTSTAFCYPQKTTAEGISCQRGPYTAEIKGETRSGADRGPHCVTESTTCEALLALLRREPCNGDFKNCAPPNGDGAACGNVLGSADQCTISCDTTDGSDCPQRPAGNGNTFRCVTNKCILPLPDSE